jgi:hypothetical protein
VGISRLRNACRQARALAVLIAAAIVVSAILQGGVPDVVTSGTFWIRYVLHRYTYVASYGLRPEPEAGCPTPLYTSNASYQRWCTRGATSSR